VAYVNSSGQPTSGSALVFNGSNLGINVTPSAWQGNNRAIQVNGGYASLSGNSSQGTCDLSYNCYNSTAQAVLGWKYTNSSAAATLYQQLNGAHAWHIAPSGTADAGVTFTQAMTLDASGNLLAGRTSVGTATSGSTIRFGASGQGIATTVYGFPITNTSYKDIAITTGGGDWNCLLLVSVSNGSNGNVATRTTYVVLGRGTTATFTSLATQNGSSGGASFTATCPSNGVMRITNTSGADVEISATVFGHGG
jgi:hypothetical protein